MDVWHAERIRHITILITRTNQTALLCAAATTEKSHESQIHNARGNLRCNENQYLMNDTTNDSLVLQMRIALKMSLLLTMNLPLSIYLMAKATATTI